MNALPVYTLYTENDDLLYIVETKLKANLPVELALRPDAGNPATTQYKHTVIHRGGVGVGGGRGRGRGFLVPH